MSKKLFAAWAKFDPNCPFEFMVEEIEIAHIYGNGVIETKRPCFVNASYSTRLFGEYGSAPLDKELVFPNGAAYYSLDKAKCVAFLKKKRSELQIYAENLIQKLNECEIIGVNDHDFLDKKCTSVH